MTVAEFNEFWSFIFSGFLNVFVEHSQEPCSHSLPCISYLPTGCHYILPEEKAKFVLVEQFMSVETQLEAETCPLPQLVSGWLLCL